MTESEKVELALRRIEGRLAATRPVGDPIRGALDAVADEIAKINFEEKR